MEFNKIYNMDCIIGMKALADNSVDAIVTDPPYELGFMGKKWDNSGIAYNVAVWKEALRVLKPGGHLLSFGGTRTYHRMACAIEDAGFEIRDMIQWLYGSGFPKGLDISKGIDKKLGLEREILGYRNDGKGSDSGSNIYQMNDGSSSMSKTVPITEPASEQVKQWQGWGTALKPANEPIVLARKPLSEKTIVDNILKWGTGAINIDDCRIPLNGEKNPSIGRYQSTPQHGSNGWNHVNRGANFDEATKAAMEKGRFPANVIIDEEAGKLIDEQSGASRFYYCPKASRAERDKGLDELPLVNNMRVNAPRDSEEYKHKTLYHNFHPTVKPIKLMEYLVKLITRNKQVVLDPFVGSGTTCLACFNLGRQFVGFEKEKQYYDLANSRLEGYTGMLKV